MNKNWQNILFLGIFAIGFLAIIPVHAATPVSDPTQAQIISFDQPFSCICGAKGKETCLNVTAPSIDDSKCGTDCTVRPGSCIENGIGCGGGSAPGSCIKLENPIKLSDTNITAPVIIGKIIKGLLGIIGALALLMIVWGGFKWLTSAGNPEKIKAGTNTMLYAIIGVVIVLSSYILVDQIFSALTQPLAPATPVTAKKVP